MCYCFFFVFVFFYETSLQKTPFDAGLGRPTRAQAGAGAGAERARADAEGGQFVKHKNNFLNLRSESGDTADFPERKKVFLLCIFLFLHQTSLTTLVFFPRPARPRVAPRRLSACSVLCCRKTRTFPHPGLRGRRRIYSNTVLTSLSRRGSRSGEHEREQRGGVRDGRAGEGGGAMSSPPLEQKPLYFLP